MASPSKQQIIEILDELPNESLATVAEFVELLRAKALAPADVRGREPNKPPKLGGIWQGYSFSDDEIAVARREAWSGLGRTPE